MAAWLTTQHSLCLHDALADVGSVQDLGIHHRSARRSVGDADSGLLFCYEEAKRRWPNARWLLIDRDFEEAWQSLMAFQERIALNHVLRVRTRLVLRGAMEIVRAQMETDPMGMIVKYEALNDREVARSIWRHLLPLAPFDSDRWEVLNGLRIEPMPGKFATEIKPELQAELLGV